MGLIARAGGSPSPERPGLSLPPVEVKVEVEGEMEDLQVCLGRSQVDEDISRGEGHQSGVWLAGELVRFM